MAEAVAEISAATQAVLGLAGLSLGAIVLYVVILVSRAVASLASSAGGARAPSSKAAAKGSTAKQQAAAPEPARAAGAKQPNLKALIKEANAAKKSAHTKEDMAAHHALFINTLKGHNDAISGLAWSPDGRLLATSCDDMQLRLFDLADAANKSKDPKFKWVRTPQPPVGVGFGNDGQSLVAALRGFPDISLGLWSPHKKGTAITWQQQWSNASVLGHEQLLDMVVVPSPQSAALGAGLAGGVAVLLSGKKAGRVLSLAGGRLLGEFEPNSLANHALAVAANGRFIAVASFTADVKVWEVQWGRDGYKGTAKVMDLKGHSSQVMSAAFSPDGGRAVTASKDGSMRLWNTAVRYQLQEDPKVTAVLPLPAGQPVPERLAWGPDGTIAAAAGGHVTFISSSSGRVLEVLHAHDGPISAMAWCHCRLPLGPGGRQTAVLATASSDRRVRLWRSPVADDDDE